MEIIELPGYTPDEKLAIAKQFLVPKQLEEHGLTRRRRVVRGRGALRLIENYTREAGVRNLEREIAHRLPARSRASSSRKDAEDASAVTPRPSPEFLGTPKSA